MRFLLTLLLFTIALAPARAEPFARSVLGLYNSAEGKTLSDNPLRENVEMVLHHLGLHLDYHDLRGGLPDPEAMAAYRGIVIWLESNQMENASRFWIWLRSQLEADRRVVLLNTLGPRTDEASKARVPLTRINAALALMGLQAGDNYSRLPLDIELVHKDAEMVEFERRLAYELAHFSELRSIAPENQVFLKLRMKSTGATSDAVVLTPRGGVITEGYLRYLDPVSGRKQWRIDLFSFLDRALGVADAPRPDCTTRNGNRLYYSHIDGDGLINLSLIDRESSSGEIIYREILRAYPALPFTVSVIVAEVEMATRGNAASMDLARRIFRLTNVEAASHTYSHPLAWNMQQSSKARLAQYTREIETAVTSGRALIPWSLDGYVFDPQKETVWSCRYIEEELTPPGKPCRVLLWSGDCRPDEETLAASDAAGLLNMNGGDSRFDGEFPSYGYVAPLYRQVGDHYQIYSSNSNENTYTNLWTGPYGGFQNVIQTFKNTESPRRLLPINVYYHFYSGERQAALLALKKVYDWVVEHEGEIHPLYASEYIEVVRGFIAARIERLGARAWRLSGNGACRTLRFDHCPLYPDLQRSTNVLGFRHYQNSLYIALGPAPTSEIHLRQEAPPQIYLVRSTAPVEEVRMSEGGLSFRSRAPAAARFTWANLQADADFFVRLRGEQESRSLRARSDASGTLVVEAPLYGAAEIAIAPAAGEGP